MKDQQMKVNVLPPRLFHVIPCCTLGCGALILLACAGPIAARVQEANGITGIFTVSETWTVTIAEDKGETPKFSHTYHGTATGTLTVTDGNYTLIDETGLSNGSAIPVTVTGTYADKTGVSKLALKGAGVNLNLTGVLQDGQIIAQKLSGKAPGQTLHK